MVVRFVTKAVRIVKNFPYKRILDLKAQLGHFALFTGLFLPKSKVDLKLYQNNAYEKKDKQRCID